MTEPRDLRRWVRDDVDDARIDRALAVVAAPPSRRPYVLAGGALAVAAAVALYFGVTRPRPAPVATAPAPVASDATIILPDGARVQPRGDADVRVEVAEPSTVALTVERGSAEFVVPHVETRRFVVHVGAYDVVDVGTTFRVERTVGSVHVEVREGAVEVRRDGALVQLVTANQTWDAPVDAADATAPLSSVSAAPSTALAMAPSSAKPRPTAKQLMEDADDARIGGRPRDAAAALDQLRRTYRTDPRAGIAAFELGRLRLDALDDPKGAVEALDDALLLAPNASFREDAEARRVEALERTHDPRCATARDAYAAQHPNGVHAADVAKRCR
jgi:hypothetical protein